MTANERRCRRGTTMRRILWTLGMTLIGLLLALKGQDVNVKPAELIIGGVWGAAIGFGLGSIFERRRPGKTLVTYWALTGALLGIFFGPLLPVDTLVVQQALGGVIGALVGILFGIVHLRVAGRKSESPHRGAGVA